MDEKHDIRQELAIILPSLDPDKKLCGVIDGLIAEGFEHIVIVDDGSDAAHQAPFEYAAGFPQCHILRHEVNKGKGPRPERRRSATCSTRCPISAAS